MPENEEWVFHTDINILSDWLLVDSPNNIIGYFEYKVVLGISPVCTGKIAGHPRGRVTLQ